MACNISIPFSGEAQTILNKAKTAITGQGGVFNGDESAGAFSVSVFGNSIAGSYSVQGQSLNLVITDKPFLIPCSTIEGYLKKQLG